METSSEDNLTQAQNELYGWIKDYMKNFQHSPSIRQMMQAMGLKSPAPIQSRLKHLQEKGYISWQEGKARTMQIVDEIIEGVPIMGSVAAGGLIETFSDVNEELDISEVLKTTYKMGYRHVEMCSPSGYSPYSFASLTKYSGRELIKIINDSGLECKSCHFTWDELVNNLDDSIVVTDESDTVQQIKKLLETRDRPAVAMDGGDIQFESFEDGIVTLLMKGACSGCPSSTATLKMGIENMLRHYIPEVQEVRASGM